MRKEYVGVDYKIEGRDQNTDEIDRFYDGKVIPFENEDSILFYPPKSWNMFLILMNYARV
jgi:hypothetical protein